MEGHLAQRFNPSFLGGQKKKHPTMAYNEADHSGRTENVPPATASILRRLGRRVNLVWHKSKLGNYTHTPKSLQCLRLTAIPKQNACHDPCPGTDLAKPLSPLETLALTSLDQTIMVLFVFDRIPSERRFPTGLFSWVLLTPTNKNAKQALFLVCILQDGF